MLLMQCIVLILNVHLLPKEPYVMCMLAIEDAHCFAFAAVLPNQYMKMALSFERISRMHLHAWQFLRLPPSI